MGVGGDQAQLVDDDLGQLAAVGETLFEGVELALVGQLAFPEQVDHFFEGGVGGEILDGIAAIYQFACDAVDGADCRRGSDYIFQGAGLRRGLALRTSGGRRHRRRPPRLPKTIRRAPSRRLSRGCQMASSATMREVDATFGEAVR